MNYLVTVLTLTVLGDPTRPQAVNLLGLVPRTGIETLPICEQVIAKAMNDGSRERNAHFSFACLKMSMELDSKTLIPQPSAANPAPFKPSEKPTVAVAHLINRAGKETPTQVLYIVRLSDFLSEGFAMGLCQNLIASMTEMHYTCEAYDPH
jgi:hypothetical protein